MEFSDSFRVSQLTKQKTAVAVLLHDLRTCVTGELAKPVASVHDGILHDLRIREYKDRICDKKR